MPKPNLTFPTGLVLEAVHAGFRHGFDIMEATGLPSGTVYPALRRLEGTGCLSSAWEEKAVAEGRPRRCYYALTPDGEALLERAVQRFPAIRLSLGANDIPETERGTASEQGGRGAPTPERA